jgi:hypothetical protein
MASVDRDKASRIYAVAIDFKITDGVLALIGPSPRTGRVEAGGSS